MLLEKLKKVLPNEGNKYPEDFQEIIQNLSPESDPNEEIITFIWATFETFHAISS